jgi:hypothetical protein
MPSGTELCRKDEPKVAAAEQSMLGFQRLH